MTKASRGLRTGTRRKLKGRVRAKFKPEKFLKEFKPGDKVIIIPDPSVQKGLPHSRFKGMAGVIGARRGSAYMVSIRMGNKAKTVITGPEHLRALSIKSRDGCNGDNG